MNTLKTIITSLVIFSFSSIGNLVIAGEMKNAANGCFPRVFSQIDQFKVSSGGLRNTNANPRSIVCSIDNDTFENNVGEIAELWMYFAALPAEMECTYYARDNETGGLLDSKTTVIDAGMTWAELGTLQHPEDFNHWDVTNYLQCKVPGNGRIFMTESYIYTPEPGS